MPSILIRFGFGISFACGQQGKERSDEWGRGVSALYMKASSNSLPVLPLLHSSSNLTFRSTSTVCTEENILIEINIFNTRMVDAKSSTLLLTLLLRGQPKRPLNIGWKSGVLWVWLAGVGGG